MNKSFKTQENTKELYNKYTELVKNQANEEDIKNAHTDYMNAYSEDLKQNILSDARKEVERGKDSDILAKRGFNVLTSEERKFFNELADVNTETFKNDKVLPETTVLRIFETVALERPLIKAVGFQNIGLRARLVIGDPKGQAEWGEIFGKIKGQIEDNLKTVSFNQNKLTAFAVVPKDLLEYGPEWVERYVVLQISEAIGSRLEEGIIEGKGSIENQPVGLLKDIEINEQGNVNVKGDKQSVGTLTFSSPDKTKHEIAKVVSKLSQREDGKPFNATGKVTLVVSSADAPFVEASNSVLTDNGVWVTALPFGVKVLSSEYVPQGKAIGVVFDRYYGAYTGNATVKEYDQTFALEDMNLYVTKHFAHALPEDNNVSVVFDVKIGEEIEEI